MSKRSDAASLLLLVAGVLLGTTAATCQNPGEKQSRTDTVASTPTRVEGRTMTVLHRAPNGDIDTLDIVAKEIREGTLTIPPAATPSGIGGASVRYQNLEQNGRLSMPLKEGGWKVRWSAALRERNIPRAVLQSGERIVVEAPVWELFDMKGKQLWALASGISPIVLDPEHRQITYVDANGIVKGCGLADGKEIFATQPLFADEFARPWLSRSGNRLTIVGAERDLDPQRRTQATRSIVELIDLGESTELSSSGLLKSARNVSSLIFESTGLVVAGSADALVVAMPNHLLSIDRDLKIVSAVVGSFRPLAISLDESRRIYLALRGEVGGVLWILSPEGELLKTCHLPSGVATLDAPPVIGYDHSIHLLADGRVLSFSPEGEFVREYKPADRVVGMAITTRNELLVSAGSELVLVDRSGKPTTIRSFGTERLATGPIVAASGDILVATEGKLYALQPSGGGE